MPLYGVYGVQGSGKDTIVEHVQKEDKRILSYGMTAILFRSLGLPIDQYIDKPFPREWYERLEHMSAQEKEDMMDNALRKELEKLHHQKDVSILTNHLIISIKQEDGSVEYQPQWRSWYPEVFNGAIYVNVTSEKLLERIMRDVINETRQRSNIIMERIPEYNALSRNEWDRLAPHGQLGSRFTEVENNEITDIVPASRRIIEMINGVPSNHNPNSSES